jgi:Ca2+-binding EF-hand superfamily protein
VPVSELKVDGFEGEKEGVMPTADVRRALIALGIPPSSKSEMTEIIETLDPDSEGYVPYASFVAISALKLHSRTSASQSAEIEAAYHLFTAGGNGPITIAHLKRIARELKEDVSDERLKDMIVEANGGGGVSKGVGVEDFEGVMKRAGVFNCK